MTTILAFDISSCSTGWSLIQDGSFQKDGYGLIIPPKKATEGQRLSYFKQEIVGLIDRFKPDYIAIEDIFCSFNKVSFKVLAMFRGVAIQTIYELTGREPQSMMAIEHRKVMGVGSKKEDSFEGIILTCGLEHLGFTFEKHNDIIDSVSLGLATHRILNNLGNKQPIAVKSKGKVKAKPKRKTKRRRAKKRGKK